MIEVIVVIAIGLVGGIAVGIQAPVAGAMAQRIGGASGSFIVHLGGAIASLALVLLRGGEELHKWRELPWYMLGSGLFGLVLYLTLNVTVPRLGAGTAIVLIIVGQLLVSMIIDHFGAFGIPVRSLDVSRVVGALILLLGAYIVIR